jgi:hypothetical protein
MVRMSDTLDALRLAVIAKLKVIGDSGTLNVELEQDGKCRKGFMKESFEPIQAKGTRLNISFRLYQRRSPSREREPCRVYG